MDPTEFIPDELWLLMMNFLPFKSILILRGVNHRLQACTITWINTIQKGLKTCPYQNVYLPHYQVIGTPLRSLSLLWAAKDTNFHDPVSDQQPRNANRGLGFTEEKWVWIRGPFKKQAKDNHRFETHICIFQEDHLGVLCRHLKKYEVDLMSDFVDYMGITCQVDKSSEGISSISWVGPPPRKEKTEPKNRCAVS